MSPVTAIRYFAPTVPDLNQIPTDSVSSIDSYATDSASKTLPQSRLVSALWRPHTSRSEDQSVTIDDALIQAMTKQGHSHILEQLQGLVIPNAQGPIHFTGQPTTYGENRATYLISDGENQSILDCRENHNQVNYNQLCGVLLHQPGVLLAPDFAIWDFIEGENFGLDASYNPQWTEKIKQSLRDPIYKQTFLQNLARWAIIGQFQLDNYYRNAF